MIKITSVEAMRALSIIQCNTTDELLVPSFEKMYRCKIIKDFNPLEPWELFTDDPEMLYSGHLEFDTETSETAFLLRFS